MGQVIYGPDGSVAMRDGRILVGTPGGCGDCCGGPWIKALACEGGAGVCGCTVVGFSPYVFIRASDKCPGESGPPAVNRVVRARSSSYPNAYGCFVLQNAPGDTRYSDGEADPAFRATIEACIDEGCGAPGCSEIATFAEARNCDPANTIQVWTCLDKVRPSEINGYYFCGGPLDVRTFNACPSEVISNAIVYSDWPDTSDPLLSCCEASEAGGFGCYKQLIPGEQACPGGGIEYNIPEGWSCVYCCDPLLSTTENAVEYSETYTDLLTGYSQTCVKNGPCDQYGTFPIRCTDSNGQVTDLAGDCSSCQYTLAVFAYSGILFMGLCSVDGCAQGNDRVEISGASTVTGNSKSFSYLGKQFFCNGTQRFEWSVNSSVSWTRGREACQGGCGLKDACFPDAAKPGAARIIRPSGRSGSGQAARAGATAGRSLRLADLRGDRAMAEAQRTLRGLGAARVFDLGSKAGTQRKGRGCATCGTQQSWQDISPDRIAALRAARSGA